MWYYGILNYYINPITKELVKPNFQNAKEFKHAFIGKKLKNGIIMSTLTSDKVSHINKIPIKNIKFFDYITKENSSQIKYISRPTYFTNKQLEEYFEYRNNLSDLINLLQLKCNDTNISKNLKLNFKSLFNLLENEYITEILEVEDNKNSLTLKVKTKTITFVVDEENNIYIEKFIKANKEDFKELAQLFCTTDTGMEGLLEIVGENWD